MGTPRGEGECMGKSVRSDERIGSRKAGGASLLVPGPAGKQVAERVARVAMGLDPINGDGHFYRAADGTLGLIVDEDSFHALKA
jgi:hypothetical protein